MKPERQLVICEKKLSPEPISSVSPEEEAHQLELADVALHKRTSTESQPAGSRAHRDHRRFMQELRDAVERIEHDDAA